MFSVTNPTAASPRSMLYCILRSPNQPLALPPGIRQVQVEGIAAVVSDADPERVRTADRSMLQGYADLIADLHRVANLIPMRYGCIAESDDSVLRLLQLRRSRLGTLLDKLEGCAELGVRLLLPGFDANDAVSGDEPGDVRPGHAHLAVIRQRFQGEVRVAEQAKVVRAAIERATVGLFRDTRVEQGQVDGRHLLSLYYLVPRPACHDFVEAVRLAPDPFPDSMMNHCLVSGPWPPYNFVGAIDDDLRCLT